MYVECLPSITQCPFVAGTITSAGACCVSFSLYPPPGSIPIRPSCTVDEGLLLLKWGQDDPTLREHQIQLEPLDETESDPSSDAYVQYRKEFSHVIEVKGLEKRIDGLMPGKRYTFRIRSQNMAGWGIWSLPVVYRTPDFPIRIGYTGEIVRIQIPHSGICRIVAAGAKAADGEIRKGGRGAIVEARFPLNM